MIDRRLLWMVPITVSVLCLSGGTADAQPTSRNDRRLDQLEPDSTIVTLPTTRRLPRNRLAFRLTHRFSRPLGQGDFGDLADDLFGLDSAAQIGLELRYGVIPGTQVGVYRTKGKTIQLFGQ